MLLEIGAWALILGIAYVGGDGVLALLGAHGLRRGDRFIIAAWCGVVVLSELLLGASLVVALSPLAGIGCALMVCVIGGWLRWRFPDPNVRAAGNVPWHAVALGAAVIFTGAALLASDPVTLYDSLVYHLGLIRWLRENGTVPGLALLHNRLGHVSAWFALGAPFDSGVLAGRAGNIPLGVALVLVALQGAIAAGRIGGGRAAFADWFLLVVSATLIWPVVRFDVATPSPDVVTNALIMAVAWSMLIVRSGVSPRVGRHSVNPGLVPFTLGVGAAAMKLFALPATVAAAVFYVLGHGDAATARYSPRRFAVCAAVGLAVLSPFLAANAVASGCPLFPSPIACLDVAWSVGAREAAKYGEYIRNVAQFERRESFIHATKLSWIEPWFAAHPIMSALIILSPIVALVLLRGARRDGVGSALSVAIMGIAFAIWQAPAPRFLYAYIVIAPALLAARWVTSAARCEPSAPAAPAGQPGRRRSATVAFVAFAVLVSASYAVSSQKLNVRTSIAGDARFFVLHWSDVLLPAASELPPRLYHWRVNDVDFFTPVPRPVADTLSYRSTIDADAGLEKCAAAPLPCTPYLPDKTVRLRVPARGIRGGFVAARAQPSGDLPRCIGTVLPPFTAGTPPSDDPRATQHVDHCSATTRIDPRSQERR